MKRSIIKIIWLEQGKTTVIMAGVHGNERAGILAFERLLPTIQISSWIVYFILANIEAIQKNTRFIEKNLNRCFKKRISWKSYEEKRAREIRGILDKADYLLDIHNTFNEKTEAFLIGEKQALSKYFPVKKMLSWLDSLHKWGSDGYMNERWKTWLCIECGSIDDIQGQERAEKSIINFLKITKNIEEEPQILGKNQSYIICEKMYTSKTDNFILSKKFKDFEEIKRWEAIWYDGVEKIVAQKNWIILFAQNGNKIWTECFILCAQVWSYQSKF